jgi:hypothetical protein
VRQGDRRGALRRITGHGGTLTILHRIAKWPKPTTVRQRQGQSLLTAERRYLRGLNGFHGVGYGVPDTGTDRRPI